MINLRSQAHHVLILNGTVGRHRLSRSLTYCSGSYRTVWWRETKWGSSVPDSTVRVPLGLPAPTGSVGSRWWFETEWGCCSSPQTSVDGTGGSILKYVVAKFGSVSPKKGMTELVFLPEENAPEVIWRSAWFPTDWVNTQVAPGTEIVADTISLGRIERSYKNAEGQEVALKSPKQAVWFRGTVSAVAPALAELEEPTFTVSEQASTYAAAWRAKAASAAPAPATEAPDKETW